MGIVAEKYFDSLCIFQRFSLFINVSRERVKYLHVYGPTDRGWVGLLCCGRDKVKEHEISQL
jgi:hypothetical protein